MVLYFECFGFITHVFWNFDSRDSHCASATDAGGNGIGIFSSLSAFCFFVSAFFSYTFPSAEIFNFGEYPRPENHRQKFLLKEGLGMKPLNNDPHILFVEKLVYNIQRAITSLWCFTYTYSLVADQAYTTCTLRARHLVHHGNCTLPLTPPFVPRGRDAVVYIVILTIIVRVGMSSLIYYLLQSGQWPSHITVKNVEFRPSAWQICGKQQLTQARTHRDA